MTALARQARPCYRRGRLHRQPPRRGARDCRRRRSCVRALQLTKRLGQPRAHPARHSGSGRFVAGDIQDPFAVRRVVSGSETVFHLAALIGIPYSYVAPATYVATNVTGTLNVLEAARDAAVGRIYPYVDQRDLRDGGDIRPSTRSTRYRDNLHTARARSERTSSPRATTSRSSFRLDLAPVQHLWAAPVVACRDPDDRQPGACGRGGGPPRFLVPQARLHVREQHRRGIHSRRDA